MPKIALLGLLAAAACSAASSSQDNRPAISKFQDLTQCQGVPSPTWGQIAAGPAEVIYESTGNPTSCQASLRAEGAIWQDTCDQKTLTCACSYQGRHVCDCSQVPGSGGCPHSCCPGTGAHGVPVPPP